MPTFITGAKVTSERGADVALIEAILVGGGTAGRMDPQGNIVQITDPLTEHYNVRLLSQAGPMIPDEMVCVDTYEEACSVGEQYAAKVDANADRIAAFRESLTAASDAAG